MVIATRFILFVVLFSLLSVSALAAENDCLYYFYGDECLDCGKMDTYFLTLEQKYPDLNVQRYEVYHNLENFELLQKHFKGNDIDKRSRQIPVVFIGNSYFIGEKSITSFLDGSIKDNKGSSCPDLDKEAVGIIGAGEPHNVLDILTFSLITGDSIRNMFRPGIIALVLVFLATLSFFKDKETIIKNGVFYIVGIYAAYLLFSFGWIGFLYSQGLYSLFYKMIGFLAILFGLAGLKSFFGTWNWFVNNIPKKLQQSAKKVFKFLLSPGGLFLLGFVGALFTFASVSESFLLLRSLFKDGFMRASVLPLLLYYILVVVLIFAALLALFNFIRHTLEDHVAKHKKNSDQHGEKWKKHYLKILNLSVRVIILVLGLLLLFV